MKEEPAEAKLAFERYMLSRSMWKSDREARKELCEDTGLSMEKVRRWYADFDWERRVRYRMDTKIHEYIDASEMSLDDMSKTLLTPVFDSLKQVRDGTAPLPIKSIKDYETLVDIYYKLTGKDSDEINDGNFTFNFVSKGVLKEDDGEVIDCEPNKNPDEKDSEK